METEENTESIKSKLLDLGCEEWKIDSLLQITNSYEDALNYYFDADWDNIDFVSTKSHESLEVPNHSNAAVISDSTAESQIQRDSKNQSQKLEITDHYSSKAISHNTTINQIYREPENRNNEELREMKAKFYAAAPSLGISEATVREKLEGVETLEELNEVCLKLINGCKPKKQIYTYAISIGLNVSMARWASEFFDDLNKAMDYLDEVALAEKECMEENQPNYPKQNESFDFSIPQALQKEEDINFGGGVDLNDERIHDIYESLRFMGIGEEESKEMLRKCSNFEEADILQGKCAIEYFKHAHPLPPNPNESLHQSYIRNPHNRLSNRNGDDEEEEEEENALLNPNYLHGQENLIRSNPEDYIWYDSYYEENKSSEEELNEIDWPRQEQIDAEREEIYGERWISSEPISIDGRYVEGTNREQIMDILSEIIPVKGLSEDAKARITEFLYDGEIMCEDCVICCEKFEEKNILFKLPCSHVFHKDCFLKYAERNENCPLDRKKI